MTGIQLGGVDVGAGNPPFIIAELSGNHEQSLDLALAMVDAAADAGAHAIKLQTYTADTMTLDVATGEFFIDEPGNLWQGDSLYSLYQCAHTPWEWHPKLFERARQRGLVAFSTPFDASAVDFLETLDVPCYKIASFENSDLPLLRRIAATGKPVILSTGMATLAELSESVETLRRHGCRDLILLKCISSYPANPTDANLATLPHLRALFGCEIGVSDHTLGVGVAVAGVALGASVIEKHFVLNRADKGVDAEFSLEPAELSQLVEESRNAWHAIGQVHIGPTEREMASRRYRRSLYISRDLIAGEILTADNVRVIRPGLGLAPKYLEQVLGRPVRCDAKKGTAVTWDLV